MVWCTQIFLQRWCGARKLFLEWWCGAHRLFLQRWLGAHRFFYKAGVAHRFFFTLWCGAHTFLLQSWRGAHNFFLQSWLFSHPTHLVPSCKSMWPSNMFRHWCHMAPGRNTWPSTKHMRETLRKNWIKKSTTTNNTPSTSTKPISYAAYKTPGHVSLAPLQKKTFLDAPPPSL